MASSFQTIAEALKTELESNIGFTVSFTEIARKNVPEVEEILSKMTGTKLFLSPAGYASSILNRKAMHRDVSIGLAMYQTVDNPEDTDDEQETFEQVVDWIDGVDLNSGGQRYQFESISTPVPISGKLIEKNIFAAMVVVTYRFPKERRIP